MQKSLKAEAKSGDGSEMGGHVHIVKGDLPHRSDDCAEMKLDGECISDEKAVEILEQKSDEALEKLMEAKGAEQKVEAQEDLTQISEQRIEKVNDDLDEIKDLIQQKKADGKLDDLEDWGPYKGQVPEGRFPNQQQQEGGVYARPPQPSWEPSLVPPGDPPTLERPLPDKERG